MRRQALLFASAFTIGLSAFGILWAGSAHAATRFQLPPPPQTVCPLHTLPILTGPYRGLCKTADGVIFNPITKQILYSPPPPLPVNTNPPPTTNPPGGSTPPPGPGSKPGTGSSRPGGTHLVKSSLSAGSFGTPSGVYYGNFGGGSGSTFFGPNSDRTEYRKVYYMSAFGQPQQSDVSTAIIDASRTTPVSTTLPPRAPDQVWLLVPFGLVLLTLVTYLVLEPGTDRVAGSR